MGFKAAPHTANAASSMAQKVDNFLPFVSLADLTTTSRFQTAEKALRENLNIKRAVGDSLGGSDALELQNQHPELKPRTCNAPVVDLTINSKHVARYRNAWGPISMFDNSAHATTYTNEILNQQTLTHQYQNNCQHRTRD